MDIKEKVKEILFELSGEEVVDLQTELQNDLSLDSLLMVTLLMELEEAFSVELDESDMNPFDLITVQDVVNLAEKYVGVENE